MKYRDKHILVKKYFKSMHSAFIICIFHQLSEGPLCVDIFIHRMHFICIYIEGSGTFYAAGYIHINICCEFIWCLFSCNEEWDEMDQRTLHIQNSNIVL